MTELEKLGKLFKQAQAAFDERDWPTAIDLLKEIIGVDAEYPDAYDLLKEAQKRRRAKSKYEKGLEYYEKEDWAKAVEELEAVVRDDPDHPDAPAKLEEARQWAEIERLLGEADEYQQKSEWERVVETLKSLLDLQKPKLDFDWDSVGQRLTEAQEKLELARLYQECVSYMESDEWLDAKQCFEELEKQSPGYEDVVAKSKETREQLELERLYHQAWGYEQTDNWVRALDLYGQIFNKNRDYRDIVARMAYCKEQRERGRAAKVEETHKRRTLPLPVWCLLGFVPIVAAVFFFAHPLHCLLEYQVTEVAAGLIVALAGGVAAALIAIVPSERKNVLWSINGGAASALLLSLLLAVCSPAPLREECFSTPASHTPSETPTPISTASAIPSYSTDAATATAEADATIAVRATMAAAAATATAETGVTATAEAVATTGAATATAEANATATAEAVATADAATDTAEMYAKIAVRKTATADASTATAEADATTTAKAVATANAAAAQTAVAATVTADCAATREAIGATATAEAMRPVPLEPKAGTLFPHGGQIHFTWSWYRELDLEKNEHFAVRLWHKEKPDEKHSLTWVETTEYILDLSHPPIDDIDFTKGDYYWNVAALGQPDPYHKPNDWKLIAESEPVEIYINVPITPTPTNTPITSTPTPTPTDRIDL